jgi:hypothetical protein
MRGKTYGFINPKRTAETTFHKNIEFLLEYAFKKVCDINRSNNDWIEFEIGEYVKKIITKEITMKCAENYVHFGGGQGPLIWKDDVGRYVNHDEMDYPRSERTEFTKNEVETMIQSKFKRGTSRLRKILKKNLKFKGRKDDDHIIIKSLNYDVNKTYVIPKKNDDKMSFMLTKVNQSKYKGKMFKYSKSKCINKHTTSNESTRVAPIKVTDQIYN